MNFKSPILDEISTLNFENEALRQFQFQYKQIQVYREYTDLLKIKPEEVKSLADIPFLPVEFFKSKKIISSGKQIQEIFSSSGTTGLITSQHFVADIALYKESFRKSFSIFYGDIKDFCVLALLPAYLERSGSSLVFMASDMIKESTHPESGFYLNDYEKLSQLLVELNFRKQKTLLLGVTFALLDLADRFSSPLKLEYTIVMETGGMKGRRKEMIRDEVHLILKKGFGLSSIHSEYGMTELLSQAWSLGDGLFRTPPWMRIQLRESNDPLSPETRFRAGGINIIDLANYYSCSFLATQDLGKVYPDGSFEVLGRFDASDIRGCNLLMETN